MPSLFREMFRTGIVTERLGPDTDEVAQLVKAIDAQAKQLLGRVPAIREVDDLIIPSMATCYC